MWKSWLIERLARQNGTETEREWEFQLPKSPGACTDNVILLILPQPSLTHQLNRDHKIVWLLVLLLVALCWCHGHRSRCNWLDLALWLRTRTMLLARRSSFCRMRCGLGRSLLPSTRSLVPLARAVAQVTASIGWLIARLKRQEDADE